MQYNKNKFKNMSIKKEKIVVVGSGVAGMYAITKLVDNGYPPELIFTIDAGKDPYKRLPQEVMIF
jgi:malic enzyme